MPAKRRYKLIGGGAHNEPELPGGGGVMTRYVQNDIVESERDLIRLFPNKFELEGASRGSVTEERRVQVQQLIESGAWTESDRAMLEGFTNDDFARVARRTQATPVKSEKFTSPLGEDVTATFPRASEAEFLVFRNAAGKHQVTTKAAPAKPLNKAALEAANVDKFVEQYLKDNPKA